MFDHFLSGAIMLAYWTAALFFLRFWRKSHDRLFLVFATAFLLLGIERVVLVVIKLLQENHPLAYGIRLCAFLLIIAAIIDKNRSSKSS